MTSQKAETVEQSMSVLDRLFITGCCVDLNIRSWQARKNTKFLRSFGKNLDDELLTGTHIKLISDETRKSFHTHEIHARQWLNANSLPFLGKEGVRFITYRNINKLLSGIDDKSGLLQMKRDFDNAVHVFLNQFEDIIKRHIEDMATLSGDYKTALSKCYPSLAEVSQKFNFNWRFYDIRIPQPFAVNTEAESVADLEETAKIRQDIQNSMRQQLQREAASFVMQTTYELRREIGDVFERFNEQLSGERTVSSASINVLRDAIDRFKSLNIANDAELCDQLEKFRSQLQGVENLKQDVTKDLRASLATSVKTIVTYASNRTVAEQVATRFLRRVG